MAETVMHIGRVVSKAIANNAGTLAEGSKAPMIVHN